MQEGLKTRIEDGGHVTGAFCTVPSGAVVEHMGRLGMDVLCLDAEHSPLGPREVEDMIRACDVVGMDCLVRVGELGPEIARALDAGAIGVVIPRVESATQAAEAVRRARYAPDGGRGAGPGRASGYGLNFAQYQSQANGKVLVVVQIETRSGLEDVDAIAAVPGVDALFIGPRDLAVSLGLERGGTEHLEAIRRIVAAARGQGRATAMVCGSEAELRLAIAEEVTLRFIGTDLSFITAGAELALTGLRAREEELAR